MIQIDIPMPMNCVDCWIRQNMGCYIANDNGWINNRRDDNCPLKAQDVPETNAGKWISVKDKWPERAGKYLVVSKTALAELTPHVKTAWFLNNLRDNSQFKYEGEPNEPGFHNGDIEGDWVERYVTHWMPLPEPPKEEGT